jgi:dipeptidyl aminopeptidase/acylaminoacyl peptidase
MLVSLLLLSPLTQATAQGTKADYDRADALRDRTRDKVFKSQVRPHWFADNTKFWYRNDLAGGAKAFVRVDATKGERQPAFDHAKLADALSTAAQKPQDPDHLPFDAIAIKDDGAIAFEALGKGWRYNPAEARLEEAEPPKAEPDQPTRRGRENRPRQSSPRTEDSPDDKLTVAVRDHNLLLRAKGSSDETRLSFEGTSGDTYEPRVFWSPDSRHLVALRTAKGDDRRVHLIASSPGDQLQPKLDSYEYLKPGDRVPITKPHLFDVELRKEVPIDDALFPNPWSIEDVRWVPDSGRFTFVYNQRGHQVLRIIAVDAKTGEAKAIVDERSPTFIDYAHKQYSHYLDRTNEIVWMSERDGWNHLYLIDATSGAVKNQVTKGPWLVRAVDRVDEEARQVWFRAGAIHSSQDPYYLHFARVDLDGDNLTVLTEGDGTHQVDFSPDRKFFIDTYSRVDLPPATELRKAEDARLVCELERADVSALEATGIKPPERFVAKGRDGATDIFGTIMRPTNFDPSRKYPVIEQIYAGPQGAFVPKAFAPLSRTQALAELGFIVVQIDGMGTNWRSKAFHDVCWKNLGDAGFPDRILWMKAAAAKEPAMDLGRVGVYGGSAGGQNALGALLFHGDFYKAAAADCGCHDNRMDKVWWNELWMGWPVGPHYAEQSNVTNAHKLHGKLLLTVGELDRNVDPASTMQVVSALIKAGKDFELVVFPGGGHGSGSSPYGERRRRDFFVRHLLGVQPPERNAPEPSATGS